MRKIASILVLVFAFTLTTQAQKQGRKKGGQEGPKLTVEQHTNLAVKKLTLALDLSNKQQNQIRPLISTQASLRKAEMLKRKENKGSNKRPTSDEIYEMKIKKLDNQIAFKAKMKDILNKEQFEKFSKMKKRKGMKKGKMMKKGKKGKREKSQKE
jgi:hypothetical protein